MQNEFVLGVLDEIWHLYNEEGFVPSTNLKKLFYLEKFFKVLQYFSVKEINEWSNSYMSERTVERQILTGRIFMLLQSNGS